MNEEFIRIRIDGYEADIPVSSLPEWRIPKFRKLLKLIRDPDNAHPEEWDRLEAPLTRGLEEAKVRLKAAKEAYQEKYIPVNPRWQTEEARQQRVLNRSLESDVKRAESQVKHWKSLKTTYDKERNKWK